MKVNSVSIKKSILVHIMLEHSMKKNKIIKIKRKKIFLNKLHMRSLIIYNFKLYLKLHTGFDKLLYLL